MRILVALTLWFGFAATPTLADGLVDEIGTNLMCQCGCTMVLSTCDCGTAEQMRGEIRTMLGEGKGKDDILNYYVGKYGEKVLAAPVPQGFNLSAYITPFAAILAGAGVIGFVIRQWVTRTRTLAPAPELTMSVPAGSPDELRSRLDRELQAFE